MSALLITDAHVAYGKVEAVRAVSLEVADNEIVTIIGANGAGKTTLLNAIMGILPLTGAVAFAGKDIAQLEIEDRVAAGLSLVPEHRELFGTMNVEDNLQLGAFRIAKAIAAQSFERVYTLFPRLKERRNSWPARCRAASSRNAGDGPRPDGRAETADAGRAQPRPRPDHRRRHLSHHRRTARRRRLGAAGRQNAQAALKIADRAYVMELGEFILNGPANEIATNPRVAASYLGFAHEGASAI